jgi:hypothetical protein
MAVDTYALTSRANFKEYADITVTDDDDLIDNLINRSSDVIETFCGRKFLTRDFSETYDGGSTHVQLRNYPVTSVKTMSYGKTEAITVTSNTSTDLRATAEVQDDRVILSRFDSSGAEHVVTLLYSSYATTSGLSTAIDGTTGWDSIKVKDALSIDLIRSGGVSCVDSSGSLYILDPIESEYTVDEDNGIVSLMTPTAEWRWGDFPHSSPKFAEGKNNIWVKYTAGFSAIPDDLEQLCIEIVHKMFFERKHDPSLASESLGGYSYSKSFQSKMTDEIRSSLLKWKGYHY